MLHILLLNRCVVINHANTCLELFFLEKAYFMCKSLQKILSNFTNSGNFGGGRNFVNTEIENLATNGAVVVGIIMGVRGHTHVCYPRAG